MSLERRQRCFQAACGPEQQVGTEGFPGLWRLSLWSGSHSPFVQAGHGLLILGLTGRTIEVAPCPHPLMWGRLCVLAQLRCMPQVFIPRCIAWERVSLTEVQSSSLHAKVFMPRCTAWERVPLNELHFAKVQASGLHTEVHGLRAISSAEV
ncbi:hypothetical protein BHE74_00039176 [Ensete ventricosum]|uniref:Uncharacterized protein n=1 Tax=Ensete ventricosum TaxID=4639 RepID=A0A444FW89_ENSVE|nr:hypothetical protein GW17_00008695 [Ensete ventricosum]RWW54255.1 hypothetical protein BHE74_00039176 [Ensete ventricosum]RZR74530.1 hypothetical protein BHM03_00038015 [Ensete ventricosum]